MKTLAAWLIIATLAMLTLATPASADSGSAAWADPAVEHPYFVRTDTQSAGTWTGYSAAIQVRPLTYAVWPGGYLDDGIFVQNGLIYFDNALYAFAWATGDTAGPVDIGPFPLTLTKITPKAGSFITFQLIRLKYGTGTTWMFRYQDALGWHNQGTFERPTKTTLRSVQYMVEQWAVTNPKFETQVMRRVSVREGEPMTWVRPSLAYSSMSDEQCGHESVTASAPASLVFRSIETPCVSYRRLF